VPAERIHTVYAGVNLTLPTVTAAPKKDPVVLFIGRDFERKGGPLLLRAFEQVRRRVPAAKLIIAGSTPRVDQPGVEVVGFIDKHSANGEARLIELYRRASVFTMPSHFEPFGIVYAEAMHFGVPCVGVDHCAMPEIVSHGVTGLLVPPDNDHALAQALIYVLRNRAEAALMGEAAITKARRLFRWEVVAGKMTTIIERHCAADAASTIAPSQREASRPRQAIAPPTTRSP
jgi:glycosyltransferase involved in cell wall biosynthesis